MAVERRNPLPVGRYYFTVYEKDLPAWNAWVTGPAKGKVLVRSSEHTAGATYLFKDNTPSSDWVLFEVVSPVPWVGLGFPTIADPEIKKQADTITAPSYEVLQAQAKQEVEQVWADAGGALGAAAGGAAKGVTSLLSGAWPLIVLGGLGFAGYMYVTTKIARH